MSRDIHRVSRLHKRCKQVLILIIRAGQETSAHVIGFTLAYLALYPEHQEKILQEVNEITGGSMPSEQKIY